MTEKQIFVAIAGSAIFFVLGFLLFVLTGIVYEAAGGHVDGGDDGVPLIGMALMVVCAVIGFFVSARWARKRFPEFEA